MNCPEMNYVGMNDPDMNNQEWICGNELSGNEPSFNPVNVSEQEIDMNSNDEGNLKNKFLINYKCKSCDEIFLNTNDAKGHSCEVETVADLDNSEHLEENDKSSKEKKPKKCSVSVLKNILY